MFCAEIALSDVPFNDEFFKIAGEGINSSFYAHIEIYIWKCLFYESLFTWSFIISMFQGLYVFNLNGLDFYN